MKIFENPIKIILRFVKIVLNPLKYRENPIIILFKSIKSYENPWKSD